jgi:tight adherence protein C
MIDFNAVISMLAFLGVFLATAALASAIFARFEGDRRRAVARLRELAPGERQPERASMSEIVLATLPRVGQLLVQAEGGLDGRLRTRLKQAGFYAPQAVPIFVAAQLLLALALPLMTVPPLCGFGVVTQRYALMLGVTAAGVGVLIPGLWVDSRRNKRQANFRRTLPDALDMLVLCVEGGLSLTAAMQRVTSELQSAHPLLAAEMNIVQREMQLGRSAGEALYQFGERCDLEEVRNLASVLLQSERYGASVVKALRIHADTARTERQQRAEEMAQKSAVKILFPTLLCIFPATFIVVLGPAAYQIADLFGKMK